VGSRNKLTGARPEISLAEDIFSGWKVWIEVRRELERKLEM
jgi:hypothetical protein